MMFGGTPIPITTTAGVESRRTLPVLQVWKAGTVMFIKRSLPSCYDGIDNPLFLRDTMMLLGRQEDDREYRPGDVSKTQRSSIGPGSPSMCAAFLCYFRADTSFVNTME